MEDRGLDSLDLKTYLERLGVATDGPLDGLRTIVETRATLDGIESLLVARARGSRVTWTEIGEALGISRQAAHARHRASPTAKHARRHPFVNRTDGDSPRPRG